MNKNTNAQPVDGDISYLNLATPWYFREIALMWDGLYRLWTLPELFQFTKRTLWHADIN